MADYWMTSAKRRLQERQNKSFGKRAKNRAQLVATHEADLRPAQQATSAQPVNHPKRHRRSKIQGGYSTYADPIARRGVAVSLHRSPIQPSPGNAQHRQPQATTGTAQYRRIRNASRTLAPLNGYSSTPFGQARVTAVPAPPRQAPPHLAGYRQPPPPPFAGQAPPARGVSYHEEQYYDPQSQASYVTHEETQLQEYAYAPEDFVEHRQSDAPDFFYERSRDSSSIDMGQVHQEPPTDSRSRGRYSENSFEARWGPAPPPERQGERSLGANWGSDNNYFHNSYSDTRSSFSGSFQQESNGIQRFRSPQLQVNGRFLDKGSGPLVQPGQPPPFASRAGHGGFSGPTTLVGDQFQSFAADSLVELERRERMSEGEDIFELPAAERTQTLRQPPFNGPQRSMQPPFAGSRKRTVVDAFLQAEFRQDDVGLPQRGTEEETAREAMEFDIPETRDDMEFDPLGPADNQNAGIARFQQRPARDQVSRKPSEPSGPSSNLPKPSEPFRPPSRPKEEPERTADKELAHASSTKPADFQTWKSGRPKRDLRPKTAPARTLDQSPDVSTGHLGDIVARKKETADVSGENVEPKQDGVSKRTENTDKRSEQKEDATKSSKISTNPYKPKHQDKAPSTTSEESLHYPCERHPSYDAPEFLRFFNGGVEVNIRGDRLTQPKPSPVRMEHRERGNVVQTPESDTLSDLDFDGKTSLWGTSVKKQL